MTELVMQKYGTDRRPLPHLGERVRGFLEQLRLSEKELAMKAKIDVRTARSAKEGSCGPLTFDALARAFGWDFIEQVMTPCVGADPLSAREAELERQMAEVAAVDARLERERAARFGRHARCADRDASAFAARIPLGRPAGNGDQQPPEGA